MPQFTTEGIVLKRSNFSEADRVLTVITPFRGKIKVLAKGVRRITSRRAGSVEILNRSKLYLYKGQGFNILTEAEGIETFQKVKDDLVLSSYASHLVEMVDRFLPEEQVNTSIYHLLLQALKLLEEKPRKIVIRAFEIKLLSDLGFWSVKKLETSPAMIEILNTLEIRSWGEIVKLKISQGESLELERILRYYMEEVLESKLKSLEVIDKIKMNS